MSTLPVIAAVDGSDDSLRALDWAADAAHGRGAPLRVVHVWQYAAAWTPPGQVVPSAAWHPSTHHPAGEGASP